MPPPFRVNLLKRKDAAMKTFIALATLAALSLGAAAGAEAGTASPKDRLTQMMAKLQGPEHAARPHSPQAKTWSMFNWLFNDLADSADIEDTDTTLVVPVEPPVVVVPVPAPTELKGLAPNRIFKQQIGKGHKLSIKQKGAGNTARVFQSN
jgi:hypothetical protein